MQNTALMLIGCGSGKDGSGSSNSGGEERVWKFAHTRAEGTENDVIARDFADNLTSSIDNLKIDIYPNNQRWRLYRGAGSYRNERSSIDVWLYVANRFQCCLCKLRHILFLNWDEAKELYNSEDGAMYKYVEERLVDQNIKLLAVVPKYFGLYYGNG